MGFFDKLKGMVNAVTGGAAKVMIEFSPTRVHPGASVNVKITATSTGGEVKSQGCFLDLQAVESCALKDDNKKEISDSKKTVDQARQISPPFVLAPKEAKVFEFTLTIPTEMPPTFIGTFSAHTCGLRGRIEAFGTDPESDWQDIFIGSRI